MESHIPACLDGVGFNGKRTLEIGLGQGADAEQIARRGAVYSGLDLTEAAVDRVKTRFALRGLAYERIVQGSILEAPFPDQTFDIIFSHGVLHHVPEIGQAQKEIHRILRPDGELVIMMYARWSLNYLVSIGIIRRLGLLGACAINAKSGVIGAHVANAREAGLWNYLRMKNFIHRNTDGPHNPYAKVYDLAEVKRDFPDFRVSRSYKRFMHAPPLPLHGLPGGSLLGWHLWVHLRPRA
jgi:SAM-dependent methyltransferase